MGEGEGEPPGFRGHDLDESNGTKTVMHIRAKEHVSETQAAHLCAEALLGADTASGVGEGDRRCEGSRAATSTETASREDRRSRGPRSPSRSALLRRQAFFSCGFRQVAHCMHRLGRLKPPAEAGRPLPPCTIMHVSRKLTLLLPAWRDVPLDFSRCDST